MGFMDEYNALKKKREEEKSGKKVQTGSAEKSSLNSFMDEYNSLKATRKEREKDEDIAPAIKTKAKEDVSSLVSRFNFSKDEEDDIAPGKVDLSTLMTGKYHGGSGGSLDKTSMYPSIPSVDTTQYDTPAAALGAMIGNAISQKSEGGVDFFQKSGLFDDGYDTWDVSKTILGTVGDAGLEAAKGLGSLGEGLGDLIVYGAAAVGDAVGADKWADKARRRAAVNMIDKKTAKADEFLEERSVLGRTSDAILQGVGQVGGIMATGGLGAAAGLGAGATTALTTGAMGLSSMGSGMGEAYQSGATDGEALAYGLISGASDAVSELIFGGLGKAVNAVGFSKGLSSLDDMVAKKISSKISSQFGKNLTEFAVKSGAEGLEEVFAGFLQAVGKKLSYMSEEEFNKILKDENLLEQFITGAVTSGFMQSGVIPGTYQGSVIETTKQGKDFITGYNQNEQAVIKKEVENRIAEAEKDGTKLTAKQKSQIEAQVEKDMEKGYISTDTIESVLGDNKEYQALLEESEEFNTLYKTEGGKLTEEQKDRLAELKEKNKATPYETALQTAKNKLSENVYGMVQNDRLSESYNERTRRREKFTADLTKYDENQKKVVQKAIDSGLLNNTNRTHEFVDILAKISADKGVLFDFTNNERLKESGFAIEGKQVNGFTTKDGITLNMDSSKAWQATVGHEVTHVLEGTDLYTELQNTLFEYAKRKGEYQTRYDSLTELYKNVKDANIETELTADLVGEYLFNDTDFINNLSTKNRNVFKKIYDEIKYLCKVATAGSKEARELEKVRKAFAEAYRANGKAQDGVTYSIYDTSGRELSEQQQDYFKDSVVRDENGNLKVMYHGTSRGGFNVFDTYGGNHGLFGVGSYFTDSKNIGESYTKKGKGQNPQVYETYLNIKNPMDMDAEANPDEWAKAFEDVDFPQSGTNEDFYRAVEEFYADQWMPKWEVAEEIQGTIESGMGYDGITHIGGGRVNQDGERHRVYIAFNPEQIKRVDNANPTDDADIRYSISDSDGKELTKEQREYFKDSKMRDENGNLKVMYHGSQDAGFHTFNSSMSDDGISLFFVDRNDVAASYSGTSETYEAKTIRTAEDMNNFLAEIGEEDYKVVEENGKFTLLQENEKVADSDTAQGIYEEYCDWVGVGYGDANYKVYLNLKNPLEVDARGGSWSNINIPKEHLARFNETIYQNPDPYGFIDTATTRNFAEYAKDQGYDGVIFKNIEDNGGYSNGSEGASTVAIAFDSNQIKSVANEKPTADPDIRYSLSEDTQGRQLTKEQQEYFKDSKAVDSNGNLQLVYHGTRKADFTVFKRNATFFTDSKEMADSYSPNGDMYEGYVNITRPYEIDAQGEKWSKIPIDAATKNFLQEYGSSVFKEGGKWRTTPADIVAAIEEAIDNGDMDYDGIIIRNVDDTGSYYKGKDKHLATDYIVFNSNQFKNADNKTPTDVPDIRRSLSNTGESKNGRLPAAKDLRLEQEVAPAKEVPKQATATISETETVPVSETAPATEETNPRSTLADIAKQSRRENFRGAYTLNGKQYLADGSFIAEFNTEDETLEQSADFPAQRALKELDEAYERQVPGNYELHNSDGYVKVGNFLFDSKYVNALLKAVENPVFSLSAVRGGYNALLVSGDNGRALLMPVRAGDNVNVAYEAQPIAENTAEELFPDNLDPAQVELENLYQQKEALESRMNEAFNAQDLDVFTRVNTAYDAVMERIEDLENEISETDTARADSLDDSNIPPEAEVYPGEPNEPVSVNDPLAERDWYEVGKNRKANAFMTDNPEFKQFFQEEAEKMLWDYADSSRGERWYNDTLHYESGGELGFGGQKRHTSKDIAELLDSWNMSWDQVEEGLRAIAEDNGNVNKAPAKHIEFMLNQRLLHGYEDFHTGKMVEPNQAYLDFLRQRNTIEQVNAHASESFDSFMQTADQYAPEDLVPAKVTPTAPTETVNTDSKKGVINGQQTYITTEDKLKNRPKQTETADVAPSFEVHTSKGGEVKGQQSLTKDAIKNESDKTATILDSRDKSKPKKGNAWNWAKEHIFSHGAVFETLGLKTGNRELPAKFDKIRRAESMAQTFIGKGNSNAKALLDIKKAVEKSGKSEKFKYYLYHMHNVDRMTLEDRFENTPNKAVFGDLVTADVSRKAAAELLKQNPEFEQWANEIYAINSYLRNDMLADNGLISGEVAELWEKMYPHYVPINREGKDGLNVNVPLDTGRTGVNAPVKRAEGGNANIEDVFDTMAQRIEQTYKAVAKNRFGVELKNTLGSTIESNQAGDMDDVLDSVDKHEELLQEGKDGRNPTFTVFENGEKVTFEITEEMYEAMKPSQYTWTSKKLQKINEVRRDILTTFSPMFALTNPIKDIGDIVVNSQHPVRTYLEIPEAIYEVLKNGKWYQERMENGGEQDTYFDSQKKVFKKEQSKLRKIVGFPFDKISRANEIIEQVPRMAEYIASRKMGRSIDVSMLDAARVTTNFGATGDFTNMLNRNGVTFLSASVEGFNQQIRNIREAKADGLKGWGKLAAKYLAAGLPALLLNHALWDDDEEYEELSDYVKQNYYIVAKFGDGKFVRIPKGRAVAVIQNAFEQMENLITGNDEVDLAAFGDLLLTNIAPNNVFDNNLIAPVAQALTNNAWYGGDLVPSRLQDLPAEEQYDETTDSLSKWLGKTFNISPYKVNYVLDQYSGGVGDMILPYLTPESDGGGLAAAFTDKFTTDSVLKNQNITDFYDLKDELTITANGSNATDDDKLKSKYMNSVNAKMGKLYQQKREIQNSDLSDEEKYSQVRDIQKQIVELAKSGFANYENITYEDDYREGGLYARIGEEVFKQNDEGEWSKLSEEQLIKYEVTKAAGNAPYATDGTNYFKWTDDNTWQKMGKDEVTKYRATSEADGEAYASDGTNHYRWYEPGEDASPDAEAGWRKLTDEQLEKQEEVTRGLGITPEEYWGNKEEYDYAYENPGKYAVSKAVSDDFSTYAQYKSDCNDFDAKDENGNTVSGLKKERVKDYIFGLDIDYGQQIILYRSMYSSNDDKATYNADIVEYLNSRNDISYEEMVAILEELDMTVDADGNVWW